MCNQYYTYMCTYLNLFLITASFCDLYCNREAVTFGLAIVDTAMVAVVSKPISDHETFRKKIKEIKFCIKKQLKLSLSGCL